MTDFKLNAYNHEDFKMLCATLLELQNTSSITNKQKILQRNSDNKLLKQVFLYTYSPFLKYGISKDKYDEIKVGELKEGMTFFDMLNLLADSNINNDLREAMKGFIEHEPDKEVRALYKKILFKDLRINMGVKNINKVYPKLIPQWEIQQAYPIDKVKRFKTNEWYCLELKMNGIRSTYYLDGFKSRQNQLMFGYQHIISDLEQLYNHLGQNFKDMVFDGELIHKNRYYTIPDNENFRLTCSIVNSDALEKPDIEFVLFDVLPVVEFNRGESKQGYKQRLVYLKELQSIINELGLENIRIAPIFYEGNGVDQEVIDYYLDWTSEMKLEGLMLIRDEKYKRKRHMGILKVKRFLFSDVRIIGYEEGEGKYDGKLGSFIINFKGTPVRVGSGYTDAEREAFWDNRDFYVGKILEVKYKEETKNKKDNKISLQFPTFSRIRLDKVDESYES